jgi:hypothetical protein
MEPCTAVFGGMMAAGVVFFVVMIILLAVLVTTGVKAVIYCMIFHKAGYHWALGLLTLVPIANLVMLFVLALGDWPILKELRQLKQKSGTAV